MSLRPLPPTFGVKPMSASTFCFHHLHFRTCRGHPRHAAHRPAPRAEIRAGELLVGCDRRESAARNRRRPSRGQLGPPEKARRHRDPVERFFVLRSGARHVSDGGRDPGDLSLGRRPGSARDLFCDGPRRARRNAGARLRSCPSWARYRAWRARAGNDEMVRHQLPLHGARTCKGPEVHPRITQADRGI